MTGQAASWVFASRPGARRCRSPLRLYFWQQWQNGQNRFDEPRRRGVTKSHAVWHYGRPPRFELKP